MVFWITGLGRRDKLGRCGSSRCLGWYCGQQKAGPRSRLGTGRRMLGGVGGGGDEDDGGGRSLSSAARHCSKAPGMWSRCVARSTVYMLSRVTSRRPVYM